MSSLQQEERETPWSDGSEKSNNGSSAEGISPRQSTFQNQVWCLGQRCWRKMGEWLCDPVCKSVAMLLVWVAIGLEGLPWCDDEKEQKSVVDRFYLMAQILTTVGYGDLDPPKTRWGCIFYIVYVLSAVLLIAQVVGLIVGKLVSVEQGKASASTGRGRSCPAWLPSFSPRFLSFFRAFGIWSGFVVTWVLFFMVFPGEDEANNVAESTYMAVITLTTVGFGDKTPGTEVGKVFASVWMILGTCAFSLMIGKFGAWTFLMFNKLSVEKLDKQSLSRILENGHFNRVAGARAKVIEGLLGALQDGEHKEASLTYANKISRNDFLVFMCIDMGLVDEDMIQALSAHFDSLDVTGEGYIDKEDMAKAIEEDQRDNEQDGDYHILGRERVR